jgi:hypothetical protein
MPGSLIRRDFPRPHQANTGAVKGKVVPVLN